jgi:predicted dienelactone hydrolase
MEPPLEPIVVPDDPAARGVATGIRTVYAPGLALEVFYPAAEDSVASAPADSIDLRDFISTEVSDLLGPVELDTMRVEARRDAPFRTTGEELPVLFFSHGLGAFRTQSPNLCDHLASRGYVVVAVDHPGRMITDLLPCLFSPALSGCDLAGFGEDNSPRQMRDAIAWLESSVTDDESFLFGRVTPSVRGILGHSAGGGTVGAMTDSDGFGALLALAAGPTMASSSPSLYISGVCDGIVSDEDVQEGWLTSPNSDLLRIHGAGHLPFSDLCELDFEGLAEEVLVPRDDMNAFFLDQMISLGTDGCPGVQPSVESCGEEFGDLEEAQRIIRHYATTYFDSTLREAGELEVLSDTPDAEWVGQAEE